MTTRVKISNKASSNGDVHIRVTNAWELGANRVRPGESTDYGITDSSVLTVFETMPNTGPNYEACVSLGYGERADDIIAGEVVRQDKMWGAANERADSSQGQLLRAGIAQLDCLLLRRDGIDKAFASPPNVYPEGWSGFRDYGSDVANLAVAAAFIRQEIKRLLSIGADTTRTSRDPVTQPYTADQPAEYTV